MLFMVRMIVGLDGHRRRMEVILVDRGGAVSADRTIGPTDMMM